VKKAAAAGMVTRQPPGAPAGPDVGSTVTITISAGPGAVPVPNVVGQTQDEATRILQEQDFLVQAEPIETDAVEEGQVAEQNPPADQQVEPGSTITIRISSGPGSVPVPDVSGQDEATATNNIVAAGLSVSGRGEESSDTVAEGMVIRTEPAAGTPVERNSGVEVVVSTGRGQVGVPNVVGLQEEQARSQLEGAGFTVNVTDNPTFNPQEDGVVASQTPTEGTQADANSTVNIVVNRFREQETTQPTISIPFPGGGNGGGGGDGD
jgi:beta-lactam-binding protein with PASTA domain